MSGHYEEFLEQELLNLRDTVARYEAVLKRIAAQSTEHFASTLATAALDGWDTREKKTC